MTLYRFMLAFDGEPQDVGILQGLGETDIPYANKLDLLSKFESLPAPTLETPDGGYVECWFTEKGVQEYADAINEIIDELYPNNWQVLAHTMKDDLSQVIYQDEYQVAYSSLYLETDKTLFREIEHLSLGKDGSIKLFFPDSTDGPFKTMNMRQVGDIFHVGTMDISKKTAFSLEGNGLSVSNCPDSWRRITEGFTHGDLFRLRKHDMKLLDFYSLTPDEKDAIQRWAIDEGYVRPGDLYQCISYDEDGLEYHSLHESYEEAFCEADEDEVRVVQCAGLLPTDKLLSYSLVKVDLLNIPDIITELYAAHVLDYDGIYWDEELNECAYSAPRGVIFNSKLSSFETINLSKNCKTIDSIINSARELQPCTKSENLTHQFKQWRD